MRHNGKISSEGRKIRIESRANTVKSNGTGKTGEGGKKARVGKSTSKFKKRERMLLVRGVGGVRLHAEEKVERRKKERTRGCIQWSMARGKEKVGTERRGGGEARAFKRGEKKTDCDIRNVTRNTED